MLLSPTTSGVAIVNRPFLGLKVSHKIIDNRLDVLLVSLVHLLLKPFSILFGLFWVLEACQGLVCLGQAHNRFYLSLLITLYVNHK